MDAKQKKNLTQRLGLGSGCGTALEHTPHERKVMGSNPTRCWAFFFSSLTYW